MNSNLQKAQRELRKIQRVDNFYGLTTVDIILDFTRPGKETKYFKLSQIVIPKITASKLLTK